jgi:hypothetical protein
MSAGMSFAEIARREGISPEGARRAYVRGLWKLHYSLLDQLTQSTRAARVKVPQKEFGAPEHAGRSPEARSELAARVRGERAGQGSLSGRLAPN